MAEEQSLFTADEFKNKFKAPKKRSKKEEKLQIKVCEYIKLRYPDVIFMCDLASGMRLPIWIAALHKKMRSSRGLPDLFIAKPYIAKRNSNNIMEGPYSGLFIEIKDVSVRLKNGSIARSEHHNEQAEILARLNQSGYKAVFGCGFEECKKIIDEYLS